MKNEKKLKGHETIWICNFCDKEFKTKKESHKHELKCVQNPKNKKFPFNTRPDRAWFYLWVTTLLIFVTTLLVNSKFIEYNVNLLNSDFLIILFLLNIGLGVFSFLAMFIRYKQKKNQASILTKNILVICLIYFLISPSVFAIEGYKAKNNEDYKNKYYIEITPTPIFIVETTITLTPTTIPKKIVQPTQKTVDTDPIIDCVSSYPNCNGSSIKLRRSQCSNITCCQIGNSWSVYPSSEKCKETQNKNNTQTNTNKYPPCTIYYPSLNRSETYYYTSPEDCQKWKDKAAAGSTQTIPTLAPIPTHSYIAPTTYIYQTPTPNQSDIDARISRCQSDCRSAGETDKTSLRNKCRANNTCDSSWYVYGMDDINASISRCISQCN
ncbi:MAG: hypothetical protein WC895_02150 [Candidatus Shapirobacteria bacterium]|jgi:hypothetical protein